MPIKEILIGTDENGNPIILQGNPILLEDDDELVLAPHTTAGWQWVVTFQEQHEIDQAVLSDEEKQILVGGSLFDEKSYTSEVEETGVTIPVPLIPGEADAEVLTEDLDVELIPDASGLFEEGLFVYEVSVGNGITTTGRVRRRRQI
jgi:hypothetical protein